MATGNLSELGRSGLDFWGGRPDAEFLRELKGRDGYKRYREMSLNSPVVAAMLFAIEVSIRTSDWQVVSDQGEEDERAAFVRECLDDMSMSFNDHISEALTMLPFGYSLFELVYKRRPDGKLGWRKFAIRGQDTIERWQIDPDGGIAGAYQRAAPDYKEVLLPIEKCLLYRTRVERNNPEGRSILRTAWTAYYYLKAIQQIEGIGVERDLAGMPVIKLPEAADTADTTTSDLGRAKSIVRNIRRDEQEGVTLPFGWELELLSTGGTRQFDTNAIIQRYEGRILMSMLTQFLILGQNTVGTYSLSADQSGFFNKAANYIADIIESVLSKFAIPRLLELNGMDPAGVRMQHTPVGDVDLGALADTLQKTSSLITWLPTDEVWWRQMVGLPDVDPEQIEEERERKQQEAMALMQQRGGQAQNGQDQEGDEEDDEEDDERRQNNTALRELYAADAPDDARRRYWERQYKRIMAQYLESQNRRIVSAARQTRR